MKTTLWLALLYLPLAAAFGQTPRPDSALNKPLAVYASAVVYSNPEFDSVAEVEFPFTLNRNDFTFFRPDTTDPNLYARIYARAILLDAAALPKDSVTTYFSVRVGSAAEAAVGDNMLFNKLVMLVKPGVYTARLTVIDVVSKRSDNVTIMPFSVPPPDRQRLTVGGPALAYRISYLSDPSKAGNNRMVKGNHLVLYNPLGVFGVTDSVAYLYAELYNLRFDSAAPSKYSLECAIFDNTGMIFRDFGHHSEFKPGRSAVVAQALDIKGWPVGAYSVRLIVSDPAAQTTDTTQIKLQIVSPESIARAIAGATTSDPYDSLSFQDRVNLVAYLLTPLQKQTLNNLTDSGKTLFLNQFWKEHDAHPDTKTTANRTELIRRYQFAIQNFSSDKLTPDGWSTDRGRIYMLYGPWDEKDEISTPRTGNPFVIWYYHKVKGGSYFVFEDQEGYRDFKLVHSNVQGERYDKDWAARIQDEMLDIR